MKSSVRLLLVILSDAAVGIATEHRDGKDSRNGKMENLSFVAGLCVSAEIWLRCNFSVLLSLQINVEIMLWASI